VNWRSWLFWGFVATLILTTIESSSQGLGLTRMDVPYMLGTAFTDNRERAKLYGFLVHLLNGWIFSLLYVFAFEFWGVANWWRGMLIGLVHGLFVLVAVATLLPGLHPRMARFWERSIIPYLQGSKVPIRLSMGGKSCRRSRHPATQPSFLAIKKFRVVLLKHGLQRAG
jgi:hypothetical protein